MARLATEADTVLVHSPDTFHYTPPDSSVLVLAGHTHGGQVCLPPGAIPVTTNNLYGYAWGLYRRGRAKIYVSRGVGEMIPPRLDCGRQAIIIV